MGRRFEKTPSNKRYANGQKAYGKMLNIITSLVIREMQIKTRY
jgi:hypothetical protein